MERDEKKRWDQKYKEGSHPSLEPDAFLLSAYSEFLKEHPAGGALDLAGGAGRHAIWLAERGWRVKLVDISEVAIQLAQKNARRRGVAIETEAADLNLMQDLGREQYELVLVFFFLQRSLFPAVAAVLKPGGWLIYKTYTTQHTSESKRPSHPEYLLEPGELVRAFASLRVLHHREAAQEKGFAELVAQKPA